MVNPVLSKQFTSPDRRKGIGAMSEKSTEDFIKSIKNFVGMALLSGFTLMGSGLVWVVHTTQQDSTDIAVVKALLVTMTQSMSDNKTDLENQIRELKVNAGDRYTATDAGKDMSIRDKSIEHNSHEIEAISRRLESLEMNQNYFVNNSNRNNRR